MSQKVDEDHKTKQNQYILLVVLLHMKSFKNYIIHVQFTNAIKQILYAQCSLVLLFDIQTLI